MGSHMLSRLAETPARLGCFPVRSGARSCRRGTPDRGSSIRPAYACIARTRGPPASETALTPGFGAPPVISFWHAFIADWNAGDLTSIVDGSAIPKILMDGPDGVAPPGSGKQDTPCERMHSAKASCAEVLEAPVAAEPLGAVPDPHAERATGRPSKTERPQRLPQRDHPINHYGHPRNKSEEPLVSAASEPARAVDRGRAAVPPGLAVAREHDLRLGPFDCVK